MSAFDHYMYVLSCGDGSLYTGYATDVRVRLAAHRAGRGAKYTKAHAPVELVAQARFYSKQRAMSAEALFKQLPRERKDRLLRLAQDEPLETVLRRELPGFGEDSAGEFVAHKLSAAVDEEYRAFMARLLPTVDRRRIVGVRTPELRAIAKELSRRDDKMGFMRALPHRLFEENQVHAFALGFEKDYRKATRLYNRFLPYVDNWATCDQLPVAVFAQRPRETLELVGEWLDSGACYHVRFGIGVLMRLYLDELFEPQLLEVVAHAGLGGDRAGDSPDPASDAYYVDMMRAWYFAEALVKQEQSAMPYFERGGGAVPLDEWTRRKAIQKALESRRISSEMKERLRELR